MNEFENEYVDFGWVVISSTIITWVAIQADRNRVNFIRTVLSSPSFVDSWVQYGFNGDRVHVESIQRQLKIEETICPVTYFMMLIGYYLILLILPRIR